jgi:hypothetical protein
MDSSKYSGQPSEDIVLDSELYNIHPTIAERKINERRNLRIPCNHVQACVESSGERIIVEVVNISRRGLCFRAENHFMTGLEITIATHYSQGGQNIFQRAKIVRSSRTEGETQYEYGVEMLK